jgi:predicted nucleotidyltransferase
MRCWGICWASGVDGSHPAAGILKEGVPFTKEIGVVAELSQTRSLLHQQLPLLAERYAVSSLGLFGSRVRGDHRADSDLDVLVTFRTNPSLLRLVELENYLSDLLGLKVDLVLQDALKPRLSRRILAEVVPV